jgi:hypothetical protein
MNWFEIIGISGTLFVLLSFLMKDLVKVRIINIIGAILFVVYGLLINALSTWLLNGVLIVIHIVYLLREKK